MATIWMDGVPEVVAPAITVNTSTGYATLAWDPSRARTVDVPIGSWTGVAVENLDVTKINDTELEDAAFNWLTGAGTSEVIFDRGAGLERYFRGVRLCFDTSGVAVAAYTISYSADGSTWHAVSPTSTITIIDGDLESRIPQWAEPSAAVPRFWKVARTGGTVASVCTEIWFFEFEDEDAEDVDVRIYDSLSGGDAVVLTVPGGSLVEPLNVTSLVRFAAPSFENDGYRLIQYDMAIRVVSGGEESAGVSFVANSNVSIGVPARSFYVRQKQSQTASLAIGNNHNLVAGEAGPCRVELVDPGGNFTITGIDATGYVGGEELILFHDGTRQGTFSHESGSSLAGNRFRMYPGANVTMTGPFEIHVRYVDASTNYFRFEWGRSSAGFT